MIAAYIFLLVVGIVLLVLNVVLAIIIEKPATAVIGGLSALVAIIASINGLVGIQ